MSKLFFLTKIYENSSDLSFVCFINNNAFEFVYIY